jgi:hypothetical protein
MPPGSITVPATGPPPPRSSSREAIEAEAEEGLLLAEYATRMRLKNRIIVQTLTSREAIDVEEWLDEVRLSLGRLRIEAEQSARRMVAERDLAAATRGRATHEHDYRHSDAPILDRRRRVYLALARRLLLWEADDERVAALLASARQDALDEMQRAMHDTVLRRGTAAHPEDEAVLQDRLQMIRAIDLPALAAERRARLAAERDAHEDPQPDDGAEREPGRRSILRRLTDRLRRRSRAR